jgi:hypothetical protein
MLIALGVILWIVLAIFALRGARWAYAIFVILAFVFIPARAGFHFHPPQCNLWPSWDLMLASLGKYKHVFLFGVFFLMTRVQLGDDAHRHVRRTRSIAGRGRCDCRCAGVAGLEGLAEYAHAGLAVAYIGSDHMTDHKASNFEGGTVLRGGDTCSVN